MINNRFTSFLLAPRYRTARHLFLQFVVFMITVNILWNVPMRPLSFPQRLLGWTIYFISIDAVFYINLYWLLPVDICARCVRSKSDSHYSCSYIPNFHHRHFSARIR